MKRYTASTYNWTKQLSIIIGCILILSNQVKASADNMIKQNKNNNHNVQSHQFWNQHFNSNKSINYPVIFIHGINATLADWEQTVNLVSSANYCTMSYQKENKNWIDKRGNQHYIIWNIRYYEPNLVKELLIGNLTRYANRLKEMITLIKQQTQQDKVILIAHSMGGLVARAYMNLDKESWNSVHKILTVGTPHKGVPIAPPIINHWRDLHKNSKFITSLNKAWKKQLESGYKQWGVVGAINLKKYPSPKHIKATSTDSGGPSYIQISSSIPFGEWKEAIENKIDIPTLNTTLFGYRVYTNNHHDGLLFDKTVLQAIIWATSP